MARAVAAGLGAAIVSESPDSPEAATGELLGLRDGGYRLAVRILGHPEAAEDAVQGAYLSVLRQLRAGFRPKEARTWFLRVVANAAHEHARRESNLKQREAAVIRENAAAPFFSDELVGELTRAMEVLEEKYRVPLALCFEEGLSQREAAEVLGIPERTISFYVAKGLEKLRAALAVRGHTAAPAAVIGALAHTAPPVPAALAAAVEKIVVGKAAVAGPGAGSAAAVVAAKGGIAMKAIMAVVLAGALAGSVAVLGSGFRVSGSGAGVQGSTRNSPLDLARGPELVEGEPGTLNSAPPPAPAPVNPYNGMQEREDVFEFTQKPAAKKEGDKVIITFASKGKCDATVAIVAPDGRIIRHLASGVLGANAPYPLQQNSLSQKVEWDGTDDMGAKAPTGCTVKVGLGLKAEFKRNILWDPRDLPSPGKYSGVDATGIVSATDKDGRFYVGGMYRNNAVAYVFDKDGKYLRTLFPPPAAEVEKFMGDRKYKFAATKWGDKILIGGGDYGPFTGAAGDTRKKPLVEQMADAAAAIRQAAGVDPKETPRPEMIPQPEIYTLEEKKGKSVTRTPVSHYVLAKFVHMATSRTTDELYTAGGNDSLFRFDGRTGEFDKTFFAKGEMGNVWEVSCGPDGCVYTRSNGSNTTHGRWLTRLDRDGKLVPFKEGTILVPGDKGANGPDGTPAWRHRNKVFLKIDGLQALYAPTIGHSNVHDRGLYVGPDGTIATSVIGLDPKWGKEHGIDEPRKHTTHVVVWNKDGRLLSPSAIGDAANGHGVALDREGNLYAALGGIMPAGQAQPWGIAEAPKGAWDLGSLAKFRGQGGKFPLIPGAAGAPGAPPKEALWLYGGLTNQRYATCTCHHVRWDMDYFARSWVPSNTLYSVVVADANGNVIARLGRYGNADDTAADVKEKKPGLRFAWMRAAAANDWSLYVADTANRRVLQAAIGYHAEETVAAP